jgi:uncharacterized membrane protein
MDAEEAPNTLRTAPKDGLVEERLTKSIIGCFYEVYNTFGFGLLEKAYAEAISIELESRGHVVRREVLTEVVYKGVVGLCIRSTESLTTALFSRSSQRSC